MNDKEKLYLKAKETYYQGNPIMSDAEFDILEDELKKEGSPVVNIVGFADRNLRFPHITPMLSLAKYQTDKITGEMPTTDAINWMKKRIVGKQEHFEFTPKFDGAAANVIYKNGKLHIALSRGDGKLGRDITNKLYNQLPKIIDLDGDVEVRGEVVMDRKVFKAKYAKDFANERNLVTGILNTDLTPTTKSRLGDIVFMAIELRQTKNGETEYLDISKFEEMGFNTKYKLESYWVHYSDFEKAFKKMENYRKTTCPFLLDGFVIKVAPKYRKQFGENSHNPNWAIAVKFIPVDVITEVADIEWTFGKTGELTPIAILQPVDLDGTVVKRASLYNAGFVLQNKILPGKKVVLVKSGDIIPTIVKVL